MKLPNVESVGPCEQLPGTDRNMPGKPELNNPLGDLDIGPLPAEHLAEYDATAQWCAEWCARRGLNPAPDDPLPANMGSPGALDWIRSDPEAFTERVRDCAYALAMEKTAS